MRRRNQPLLHGELSWAELLSGMMLDTPLQSLFLSALYPIR